MRKKRLTSLLLSACMVLGMLLPSASAVPLPGQSVNFSGNPSKALDTDQVVYEVTGSGSRKTASFETAWNELTGQYVKGGTISLIKDVKAANGSFGKGTGFSQSGTITLPTGRVVTLDLNGHSIDRALSAPLADGGVLAVYGTLTLKDSKGGGTLRGGSGSTYGGVYVRGTFNMEGGSISANTAQTQGGGLYNAGSVQLKKGSITNNNGGGVYQGGSFSLSGAVSITGNTAAGGALCNLYLPQGRMVSTIGNGLQNGARVGVSAETAPSVGAPVAVASGTLAAADAQRFTSDAGHIVKLEGGRIVLQVPEPAAAVPSNEVPAASNSLPANTGSNAAAQTAPEASASAGNTVILYSNGGSWTYGIETSRVVTVTEGMRYGDLPEPRRTGYQFDGWKGRGNTLLSPSEYVNSGESPLTAQWTANRYQASFNLNYADAPDTPSPVTVTYQQRYGAALGLENGRLPKPTRPGYQFRGWCVKPYGGVVVTENMLVGIPKDHTLYALWLKDAEEYAVTFLSKRPVSSEEPVEQCVLVVKEKEVLTLPTAEECGFTIPENQALKAWNNLADSKTPPTDYYAGRRMSFLTDTTFCAVWEDAYPVILDPNGGRWADLPEEQAEAERTEYAPAGRLTSTLPLPEQEGKTFAGWFDAPEDGEYVEDLPAQIASQTEDTPYTLYAYWGENIETIPEDAPQAKYTSEDGKTTNTGTFADMWELAADNGGTVQLLTDVTAVDGKFYPGSSLSGLNGFSVGGALYVPDGKTVTLDLHGNTLSRGLTAEQADGDVIYVGNWEDGAVLTVNDTSTIGRGKITGGYSSSSGGGIVVAKNSTLMLKGGFIEGNKAENGGGIYSAGTLTMSGGYITKNTAVSKGGGIYSNGTLNIKGGYITDNRADLGGAIFDIGENPVMLAGGEITGNFSDARGSVVCGGGRLSVSGSPYIDTNMLSAGDGSQGADVWLEKNDYIRIVQPLEKDAHIVIRVADDVEDGSCIAQVEPGFSSPFEFKNQLQTMQNRRIYQDPANSSRILIGTPSETPEAEYIPVSGSPKEQGTFADMWNRVTSNGGTIRLLKDIKAANGNFGTSGTSGRLLVNGNAIVTIDLNGHTLDRNLTQAQEAGEVILNNGTLTIKNGTITGGNNSAPDGGGGITNTGALELENVTITDNHTAFNGGGIYNNGNFGGNTVKITKSSIQNNTAGRAGGGIYHNGTGAISLADSSISRNAANGEELYDGGGGIYKESDANLTLSKVSIDENTAKLDGGGIYNKAGNLMVTADASIKNNFGRNGGGIYNNGVFMMTAGAIIGNYATSGGGAIFNVAKDTKCSLQGGEITHNTSQSGGSVTSCADGNLEVSGSVQIRDNVLSMADGSTEPADVYLTTGRYITIVQPLDEDARIGVRVEEPGVKDGDRVAEVPDPKESFPNANGEFFSNQEYNIIQNKDALNQLILEIPPEAEAEYIPSDGSTPYRGTLAKVWVEAAEDSGSTVRLLRNVTAAPDNTGFGTGQNYGNGALYVPDGVTLTLDLNGCTLDRGLSEENSGVNSSVIRMGQKAELTVKDSAGGGKITGGRSPGANGGGITSAKNAKLTLEGGSITGNVGSQGGGVSNGGTFIMTGGSIDNNTSIACGGGIHNLGTVEIRGGSITNNKAAVSTVSKGGGGIYNDPNNFKGLTVSGSPQIHSNTAVELDGSTVPSDVYLLKKSGTMVQEQYITIDKLDSSARIGVRVEDPKTEKRLVARGSTAITNDDLRSFSNNQGYIIAQDADQPTDLILNPSTVVTVTLEEQGGTLPAGSSITFQATAGNIYGYGNLPTPFYDDDDHVFVFIGWFTEAAGGTEVKEDTQVPTDAKDHTLYAHWTVTHTVTLDVNGGDALTPNTFTVAEGGTYPAELPTPTRTGFTFEGWYTAADGGSKVEPGAPFTANTNQTLYAHWKPTTSDSVIITLDANYSGGTVTPGTVTSTDGKYPTLPTPTRTGYTFAGWYTAASGGTQVNAGGALAQATAHTLYAHWTQNQPDPEGIKVTLDPNGGSVSPTEITVKIGGSYTPLPIATRSNYIFDGWFTAASGGTQITTGVLVEEPVYRTLYAHWHRKSSGGGSGGGGGGGGGSSSSKDDDDDKDDRLYITATSSSGGSISPSGQTRVSRGSSKTYTITPNVGYSVSDVLVDGKSVGQRTSYTFSNITSSHTIRAAFTRTATTPTTTPSTTTTTPPATTSTSRPGTAYNVCPKDHTCPIAPYTDSQPTAWYHDGVHYCIDGGLMIGTTATTFEPNTPLSRGMLAQILYNREGKPAVSSGGSSFTDVPSGAWYENAVKRAASTGLVVGYESGAYGPGDAITREQLAVVLWRHAGSPIPAVSTVPFDDYRNTREFARDAVRWAYGRGILNGKADGSLDPGGRASRAEVAQMLKNYLTT